jgi:hypothetical protein
MTEINAFGSTFVGTAEGDHGVFAHCDGHVYAGQIAGDHACIGVLTWPSGNTTFVECDADGKRHGRELTCNADEYTAYIRYEHGSQKEYAVLYADGTCAYDGTACRADYAPFMALQAMVVPIKARPTTRAPNSRLSLCRIYPPPPARQSVPSAIVLAFAGAGDDPRRQGAHLRLRHPACMARASHSTAAAKQMRRASDLDDAPGRKGVQRMRHTTTCVVHPSAVPCTAEDPRALPPL